MHRGPISRLVDTVRVAHAKWLPGSEYEHDGRPELEYYDHRFRGDDADSEVDYLVPVRRRKISRAQAPRRPH